MKLGLMLTARCNAACLHCATNCGPARVESLSTDEICRFMDDAASVHDGVPLCFQLSGGEPFLDFPMLIAVLRHGQKLGARLTCVSNAFWASNDEKTLNLLSAAREAGLAAILFSVSRFHERFVPFRRVRRAVAVAKSLGLETTVKCATTRSDHGPGGALESWRAGLSPDTFDEFPVYPSLREGAQLPDSEYSRRQGIPSGRCTWQSLVVKEDGSAYPCGTPGAFIDFFKLGNAREQPVRELNARLRKRSKERILRDFGPIHFAAAVLLAGEGRHLRGAYGGVCDLCTHIAGDPTMAAIADEVALASENESPSDNKLSSSSIAIN